MLWIALADDASDSLALDHLAVLADRLHTRTNLHTRLPGRKLRGPRGPHPNAAYGRCPRKFLNVASGTESGRLKPRSVLCKGGASGAGGGGWGAWWLGSYTPQPISRWTASHASPGSAAAMIGRPTTRWVAPCRTASAGVAVRT